MSPEKEAFLKKGYAWILPACADRAGQARLTHGRNDIVFIVFPRTGAKSADFFHGDQVTVTRDFAEQHPECKVTIARLREKLPIDKVWALIYDGDEGVFCFDVEVNTGPSGTLAVVN